MRIRSVVAALSLLVLTGCTTAHHNAAAAPPSGGSSTQPGLRCEGFTFSKIVKTPMLTALSKPAHQGAVVRVAILATPTSAADLQPADAVLTALEDKLQVVFPPIGQKYSVAADRPVAISKAGTFVMFSNVTVVTATVKATCADGYVHTGHITTWSGQGDGIYQCDSSFTPPPLPLAAEIRTKGCDQKQ
jgi:hypothetical protein